MKKLFTLLLLLVLTISTYGQERFQAVLLIRDHMKISKNWVVKVDRKEKSATFKNTVEKYTIIYQPELDFMEVVMDDGKRFFIDNLSKGGMYTPMETLLKAKKISFNVW